MSHTSKGNKSRFNEPGGTFGLAGAARSGRENSMRKQGAISWKDAGAPRRDSNPEPTDYRLEAPCGGRHFLTGSLNPLPVA